MLKVAVLVSGGGTNLQALIDAERSGIIKNAHISLVVSDKKGVYALERAKKAGIKTAELDKKAFPAITDYENEVSRLLDENDIGLVVLGGFLTILSEAFVKRHKIINVHPSLIPAFCGDGFYGLKVHEAALSKGVKVTGATVHYVNEITDGGEIILQKAVEVMEGDTPEILQRRVMEQAEWIILPKAVELIASAK